ncbi:spermatogenesis-associated protein 33 isoform X2 [Piliocolobus tephrosceles]|uniref:spermatogenesis-associated protein 33 isoform X2 n=1 Tax=Piliocolobus tephrosceles TaxID=591936 RepID=UPI000C2AFAA4|nr:spermatogenesis-associated protein 33 isoform X2 [Piliocolobus tephrosceles]
MEKHSQEPRHADKESEKPVDSLHPGAGTAKHLLSAASLEARKPFPGRLRLPSLSRTHSTVQIPQGLEGAVKHSSGQDLYQPRKWGKEDRLSERPQQCLSHQRVWEEGGHEGKTTEQK